MTQAELDRLQKGLKITLPQAYRQLMLEKGDAWKNHACFLDDFAPFWIDPQSIQESNLAERHKGSGTAEALPGWWKKYVLIGTDGAGGFYALRLDDAPGVWIFGSDEDEALVRDSLPEFAREILDEFLEEQAEEIRRWNTIQGEFAAEMAEIESAGDDKAREWLTVRSSSPLLKLSSSLDRRITPRKMRLFGVACCRRLPGLSLDTDCLAAVELAEQASNGLIPPEALARMRSRLAKKRDKVLKSDSADPKLWLITAAQDLLQSDEPCLGLAASDEPGSLSDVASHANSAACGTEFGPQSDLLREVLGNPFLPAKLLPAWRTPAVVKLARTIAAGKSFRRMPELADLLRKAGCDNARILAHASRVEGHVPGCWLLDLILEQETLIPAAPFQWDFQWEHPRLDAEQIQRQLETLGASAIGGGGRITEAHLLPFAEWLKQNGESGWASYVRVRCRLDGKIPGKTYPDLVEELFESAARASRIGHGRFDDFYFGFGDRASRAWWEDRMDGLEGGVPSQVDAVSPGSGPGPVERVTRSLEQLVHRTPVRAIDLEGNYAAESAEVLRSPGGRKLRGLAFKNRPEEGQAGPVITSLARSPLAASLGRLLIGGGLASDQDALALAAAPFRKLKRLDLSGYHGVRCSSKAARKLMTSEWFRRLEQLSAGFSEECCEVVMASLAAMPKLHSLMLRNSPDKLFLAMKRPCELKGLRRLCLHRIQLAGEQGQALAALIAPNLIQLDLRITKATPRDLEIVAGSLLGKNLRMLSLSWAGLDKAALEVLSRSCCTKSLRALHLDCGDGDLIGRFRSLSETALADPAAFPSLTTLSLRFPYTRGANRDAAELLRRMAIPSLKHLSLTGCEVGDEGVDALTQNPCFAGLTRLEIDNGDGESASAAADLLTSKGARTLFRSEAMRNLIELTLEAPPLGKSVELLLDRSNLPNLSEGWIRGSDASEALQAKFQLRRPEVYVS